MSSKQTSLQPLIDELYYHGSGSRVLLNNLVDKYLDFLNLNIEDSTRRILKLTIINRLRTFGFLEILNMHTTAKWYVMPPSLIQLASHKYLIFCPTGLKIQILSSATNLISKGFELHISSGKEYSISLALPEIYLYTYEANKLASVHNMEVVQDTYRRVLASLPALESFMGDYCILYDEHDLYSFDHMERFSYLTYKWNKVGRVEKGTPGLYRKPSITIGYNYFLLVHRKGEVVCYEMRRSDWLICIAGVMLDESFQAFYSRAKSQIRISISLFRYLPLVIRRALVVHMFKWPEKHEGYWQFDVEPSINLESINFLLRA